VRVKYEIAWSLNLHLKQARHLLVSSNWKELGDSIKGETNILWCTLLKVKVGKIALQRRQGILELQLNSESCIFRREKPNCCQLYRDWRCFCLNPAKCYSGNHICTCKWASLITACFPIHGVVDCVQIGKTEIKPYKYAFLWVKLTVASICFYLVTYKFILKGLNLQPLFLCSHMEAIQMKLI